MPEHANRFAGLYDQHNENRIADWGGDELFTRMPKRPVVDDAPAPRFRPSLMLVDTPADRHRTPAGEEPTDGRERRREQTAEEAMRERAERVGLAVVDEPAAESASAATGWDALEPEVAALSEDRATVEPADDRAPNGRRTTVITGRPDGPARPLSLVPSERRRPARTPAGWIGSSPERIMAWAFVLGLLLILIAISTADAATR
jgi:hypothetical protein